jgi:hypothetical protein
MVLHAVRLMAMKREQEVTKSVEAGTVNASEYTSMH